MWRKGSFYCILFILYHTTDTKRLWDDSELSYLNHTTIEFIFVNIQIISLSIIQYLVYLLFFIIKHYLRYFKRKKEYFQKYIKHLFKYYLNNK